MASIESPRRILVVDRGDKTGTPEGQQVQGFDMYHKQAASALTITIERQTALSLDELHHIYNTNKQNIDYFIFMVAWSESAEALQAVVREMASVPHRPRLIFLDYYAPTCSPHFGVLAYVDRYIKRQILRDRSLYELDFDGGYIFTHFLTRDLGYDLNGWHFGSKPEPAYLSKLVRGWNLGVCSKYRKLLRASRPFSELWPARPYTINRRFGRPQADIDEWYHTYRRYAQECLDSVVPQSRHTGVARLSPKWYLLELLLSKIVVSPFGWGELCFRDYEAVAAGALLIKPCMDHLETSPDIFKPYETYVPVRWDLTDLPDVCGWYVRNPRSAVRIVRAAQSSLSKYYENGGFINDLHHTIDGLY